MKRLLYYIKLYYVFIKNTLTRETDYRANFIGDLVDSIANFSVNIIFFEAIFLNVDKIAGWGKHETLLLVGTAQLITGIVFVLYMNNLPRIQTYVIRGSLDYILLKPCDEQFYISSRYLYFGGISNIILSCILVGYTLSVLSINIEIAKILVYIILVICGVSICYSMWFMIMTCSVVLIKVNELHELFLSTLQFMQYPGSIYSHAFRIVFMYIIPFITIANAPVEYIIEKATLMNSLYSVLVAAVFLVVSRMFWKLTLRWYQSASS